jgi:hypothetical protein
MPTERSCAAALHGVQDGALGGRQGVLQLIRRPILAYDIREFEARPAALR